MNKYHIFPIIRIYKKEKNVPLHRVLKYTTHIQYIYQATFKQLCAKQLSHFQNTFCLLFAVIASVYMFCAFFSFFFFQLQENCFTMCWFLLYVHESVISAHIPLLLEPPTPLGHHSTELSSCATQQLSAAVYFTRGGVYIVSATLPVHPTLPFLLLHVSLCPTLIEETIIFLLHYSITFINQVVMQVWLHFQIVLSHHLSLHQVYTKINFSCIVSLDI